MTYTLRLLLVEHKPADLSMVAVRDAKDTDGGDRTEVAAESDGAAVSSSPSLAAVGATRNAELMAPHAGALVLLHSWGVSERKGHEGATMSGENR